MLPGLTREAEEQKLQEIIGIAQQNLERASADIRKVNEDLEYYSVVRSIRAIEGAEVCTLMVDATRGIESQDLNIFSLIQKNSTI